MGRKGTLLAGLAVVGTASLAGGFTTSAAQLIAARAVMGLGAALTFPATLSLIANVFTERRERARAIGLWGTVAGVAIAMGPIVGGWLLEHFSWAAIFIAMAPIAAVAAILVALAVPASEDPDAAAPDIPGLVLSSAAMALLVFTIIEAPAYGWAAARSVAGFAASAVLLAASSRRSGAPRTRCSTWACSATCGSARPAARSRCRSSPCSVAGPATPGTKRGGMPGASSHSHARPVAGFVTVAASTSVAGDQENGPALASTGRAAARRRADPTWSADGRLLLYVRGDGLWLLNPSAGRGNPAGGIPSATGGRPARVVSRLFKGAWPNHYGYIDWRGQFAWHD